MGPGFVQDLPVGKFHGIGPATSAKMNGLGIFTGMDMRNQTLAFMTANFGKAGTFYYWISRGIDNRPVRANRIRKSIGAENTFSQDLADYEALAALSYSDPATGPRSGRGHERRKLPRAGYP